jgi:hypothetical protein
MALTTTYWSTLQAMLWSASLRVLPDGAIDADGVIVGRLLVAPCDLGSGSGICANRVGTSVGQLVNANLALPPYSFSAAQVEALVPPDGQRVPCYFPLYAPIVNGTVTEQRIIAFGVGELEGNGAGAFEVVLGWTTDSAEMSQCSVVVAPDNASASLPRRDLPALPNSVWNQIFEATNQFVYPNGNLSYAWQNVRPGTALAPALIR